MATIISRMYGPAQVAAGPATVLTAAATERIRMYVHVSNPSANTVNFSLSIGADAAGTRLIGTNASNNIPGNTAVPVIFGPYVVMESEIVQLSASPAATAVVSFHGERRQSG